MVTRSPIQTLIELAEKQTGEAAKRLAQAMRASEDAEQKLTMLRGYRDDYNARFGANMASGITPMEYRNFQAFLAKLDTAVNGQQEIVFAAERRITAERGAWQASERKRMSFTVLANRAQKEEQLREAKRDQKAMDEFASRRAFDKR